MKLEEKEDDDDFSFGLGAKKKNKKLGCVIILCALIRFDAY